jgi:glycosyltransferase involved in cell wall biosynthesis
MFDIVMPLYNKEEFVGATIDAVLAQSFADWRLIVVDDGSSDGGAEVVRGFDDPRITLIEQKNRGVGPARNVGIRAGANDWIAFLDADDIWNADHLAELNSLRRDFPQAGLIGCAFTRFSRAIEPEPECAPGRRRLARYFRESADGHELLVTSSAAVRRQAILEVGDFENLPGNEDVELWARLALHAPVAVSSRPTANYRVDSGGITDKGMGRKVESKPTRREDLSSTIPTLERVLPAIRDDRLREDIFAYMDSRIGVRMTAAVLDGDIDYARQLLGLYRGKPAGNAATAAQIAKLPRPLGRSIISLRRWIKHPGR